MFFRAKIKSLLQIFCPSTLYCEDIFKSIVVADDNVRYLHEHEVQIYGVLPGASEWRPVSHQGGSSGDKHLPQKHTNLTPGGQNNNYVITQIKQNVIKQMHIIQSDAL